MDSADINSCIRSLILRHDRVVVPGLGTFTATYVPPETEAGQVNSLLPPRRKVAFSIHVQDSDDNTLFKSTARMRYRTEVEEIDRALLQYIEEVHDAISLNNAYCIDGLGQLTRNEQGSIVLDEDLNYNQWEQGFGLPYLQASAVEKSASHETERVVVAEVPVQHEEKKPVPVVKIPEKESTESHQTAITETEEQSGKIWWWVALVPLVIIFAGLLYLFLNKDAMTTVTAWFGGNTVELSKLENDSSLFPYQEPDTNNDNTTTDDWAQDSSEQPEQNFTSAEVSTPKEEPPQERPATAGGGNYYVVVGSFSSEAGAGALKHKLESNGYSVRIVPHPEKNVMRVMVGGFASEEAAEQERIKLDGSYRGAWITRL